MAPSTAFYMPDFIKLWMSSGGGIIELLIMRILNPRGALCHVPDPTFRSLHER